MREANPAILIDLIQAKAAAAPDLDVLTFEHQSLDGGATPDEVRTYAALADHGNRIAAALADAGLAPGERVALMMRNHPEFVEAMIAASQTATVVVPIDPRIRGEKLAYMLRHSGCRGVVCADYCLDAVLAARAAAPEVDWIWALETGDEAPGERAVLPPGVQSLRAILATAAPPVPVRLARGSDPLQIIYTSGTTGDPKGVVFPNERFGLYAFLGVIAGFRSDDRPYTGLSLTHGNAQAVTLGPALHMGLRAVFSRRFTKSRLWDVCRHYGCTTFSLLGGMAMAIYSEPPRPDDADNPVRLVTSAGMPVAIWEAFERRFGVAILEWYAAIEGGIAFKPVGEGPIGSFGKPPPTIEMKILDDEGRECPPYVPGEICSRPADGSRPSVEYLDNPEASGAKTAGGWLHSGDIGHTDAEGWFFFDYRKDGAIRHNGEFINPGFVEKVLAEQPSVTDVCVYGVPAASGAPGEKDVVAAVVPAGAPDALDVQALFAACRAALEPNAVPAYIHVVQEIPKTASEKPQERFLIAAFRSPTARVFTESR